MAFCVRVATAHAGWLPLASCLAVLVAKQVDASFALYLLGGIMAGVCVWQIYRRKSWHETPHRLVSWQDRSSWVVIGLLWTVWGVYAISSWQGTRADLPRSLVADRPIVCLGDSLTAYGYPQRLAERINIPVVNLGQDGITIADGIERLPQIRKLRAQVVVIELGGHDHLREHSLAQAEADLRQLILGCRAAGAEVVLVEVARGFITDPYGGYERRLAREYDLQLVPDTAMRKLVIWSAYAPPGMWLSPDWHYSSDGLHPNPRGNEMLAAYVQAALPLRTDQLKSGNSATRSP